MRDKLKIGGAAATQKKEKEKDVEEPKVEVNEKDDDPLKNIALDLSVEQSENN